MQKRTQWFEFEKEEGDEWILEPDEADEETDDTGQPDKSEDEKFEVRLSFAKLSLSTDDDADENDPTGLVG